jgi:hypothetical protein
MKHQYALLHVYDKKHKLSQEQNIHSQKSQFIYFLQLSCKLKKNSIKFEEIFFFRKKEIAHTQNLNDPYFTVISHIYIQYMCTVEAYR